MDLYFPPFSGIALAEHRDRIEITPTYWVREIVGLGRCSAHKFVEQQREDMRPFYSAMMGDKDVWVIATWRAYDDGREEEIRTEYLDGDSTEAEARESFEGAIEFQEKSKEELEELMGLFEATDDDRAYIEERFPDVKLGPPDSRSTEDHDVYQARLKVLGGMLPKTVALIQKAEAAATPAEREKIEREAVQAYFADMAHHWTEDSVMQWQRTNPLGSEWMVEFARVFREPERDIDPINYELALNWVRQKYNLLTEGELSDAILVATGQRVMPGTLKKRRERLGLTTKRQPGPRPNSEQ
jgi:hypothetical protein